MAVATTLKGLSTVATRTVLCAARTGPVGSAALRNTGGETNYVVSERFLHWTDPLPADASVPEASSSGETADKGFDEKKSAEHYASKHPEDLYGKVPGQPAERAAETESQHDSEGETLDSTGFDMSKMSRPAGDE